jgi:molybdopterin-guanine dinucleotide biosynthesis protein B
MFELAVVGAKNAGKTTVIEGLVAHLTAKGYRVATIKHTSHHHGFDTPGKDSHRHRRAGAALTVAMSGEETAVFSRPESFDVKLFQRVTASQFDIWLIEGYHLADHPKVLVTRRLSEFTGDAPKNIIASIGPDEFDDSLPHFDDADYEGLGSFVIQLVNEKQSEMSK